MFLKTPNKGRSALLLAANHGYIDIVKYLLEEKDFDIKDVDNNGATILHHTAMNGNLELFKYLEKKGTDLDLYAKDNSERSILFYAIVYKRKNIARYLIEEKKFRHDSSNSKIILGGALQMFSSRLHGLDPLLYNVYYQGTL